MDQFFVIDAVQKALFVDEVSCHHAMTKQVKTTAEIEEIFDAISYQKGEQLTKHFNFQVPIMYYDHT